MLNIRIVYVDYYLSKPILNLDPLKSPFNNEPINIVPIIRIFGTTHLTGEKCCSHIHGFFPYLTIERDAFSNYSIDILANELTKQLNDFYSTKNTIKKETNRIYDVQVIESKSIYGYRERNQEFLRFQFFNPKSVKLAFKILKQGKLFGQKCNVYEAHITYIMQFFVNFKLAGMNYLNLENYYERKDTDRGIISKNEQYLIKVEKQSVCKLEIDIITKNIIVQQNKNKFINPGLVLIWQEEKRRLIESNKNIKGIFESNLRDLGNRNCEKKSLELNYLKQLKDYLIYNDNFNSFCKNFNNSSNNLSKSVCSWDSIRDLNQSLSQTVIEKMIENEKLLAKGNHLYQISSIRSNSLTKLSSKDICSQDFLILIKNLKNNNGDKNRLNRLLNLIEESNESESGNSGSDDELNFEKEARFTQLMFETKVEQNNNSFCSTQQSENQLSRFTINKNHLNIKSKKTLELEESSKANVVNEQISNNNNDSSLQFNPENFNLNNESMIFTPTNQYDKTVYHNDSKNLKRPCAFDDQIGHLVSLNDEPLFDDDDDDDNNNDNDEERDKHFESQPSQQLSEKSYQITSFSQQNTLSQLSDTILSSQPLNHSQTDNKSIFSFYSLESDLIFTSSQSSSDSLLTDSLKTTNCNLNIDQQQANTSTPANNNLIKNKREKYRIRKSLGTKFMKLSQEASFSGTQSPTMHKLPIIQIQSSNESMNGSDKSSQSKYFESSFTMNEKIKHLSESYTDNQSSLGKLTHEIQNLTQLTMELFATTNHELKPNPLYDSIRMIFYMIHNDYTKELLEQPLSHGSIRKKYLIGIIIQESKTSTCVHDSNQSSSIENTLSNIFNQTIHKKKKSTAVNNFLYFQNEDNIKIEYVSDELSLIYSFIQVLIEHDPDIITGYEIETSSWGFLISRAEILKIDVSMAFSRLLNTKTNNLFSQQQKKSSKSDNIQNSKSQEIHNLFNKTQCEEDDQFELSDYDEIDDEEEENKQDMNPILNNNYLNRHKWESLEHYKKIRPDLGTFKTREDLRNKVKGKTDLIDQYQSIFSLSWVSPCYMSFVGRIMLNLWRCIRKSELALNSYTFENVYYKLFKRRKPYYSPKQLTQWYNSKNNFLRQNVLNYFLIRIKGNIEITDQLGIVNATSELARVFGIQFSDVISKGSQFRVESLLYRSTIEDNQSQIETLNSSLEENFISNNLKINASRPKNSTKFNKSTQSSVYLNRLNNKFRSIDEVSQKSETNNQTKKKQKFMLLSCNFDDRLNQQDPVIIPFIMEPKHGFYTNNVAVLDFQSLYPSIMIAYNYCYSTCLGRLDYITNNLREFPLGFAKLQISTDFIKENVDNINISPNGIIFCKKHIRKGILSNILEELLDTRLMVKKCLKMYDDENEKRIVKLLDARQLGLKLLANVTYGYTAAGFSGRMPMIDLADSIISKARETLINSINFINNRTEFGGEVIYGDTDSMFVEFKNTTRKEAFEKATKLCELITLANPNPIKLKLEKIYSECVLLTKKHYAGYAYESPDQKLPKFEAKGIEIIRRDTIDLVKKVMEHSLKLLFKKRSIDEIKPYLESVFYKIIYENGEHLHQYIYAKEYRGVLGYRPKTCIPSIEISNQIAERYGEHCRPFIKERVPYVISYNEINDRLIKIVHHPIKFLENPNLRINSTYYIDRVLIPPIQRVFGLLNLNIRQLYSDLPKKIFYFNTIEKQNMNLIQQTNTLANYFNFVKCSICDRKIDQSRLHRLICDECVNDTQSSVADLLEKLRLSEINLSKSTNRCLDCTQMNCIQTECRSIECDNIWLQNRLFNEYKSIQSNYRTALHELEVHRQSKFDTKSPH